MHINYETFVKYCGYNEYIIKTFSNDVNMMDDTLSKHGETLFYDYSNRKEFYEFLDYIEGPNIEIVPTSQYVGKILIHYDNSEV